MIPDKFRLLGIIDRIEIGIINAAEVRTLREAVQRLDEMDDLVDAVCTCRTQEIPVIRMRTSAPRLDDDAPGRP